MSHATPRVLHVISSVSLARGGPSVAIGNILKALRQRRIDADVVTTNDDGDERCSDVPLNQFVELHGQRIRYFPRQTGFYHASVPMLRWLVRRARDYDLMHTHGLFDFPPVAAAQIARFSAVPYIMRPAGMLDHWSRINRRPRLKRASLRLLEGPLLRRAARVHFTSHLELQEAGDAGSQVKPVILPLGLDLEVQSDSGDASRFQSELADIDCGAAVLYLSRIAPKKGLDVLLQAFALTVAEHPRATLLIAGDGPSELVAGFQRQALDLGLSARQVRWLGFVQGADKHWLLRRSAVFVLPSKSENFGVAAAEAIAAGLPVVLTRGVAMAELVGKANCGIVADGTAENIHLAISALLANAPMREEMSAAGRRCARDSLSLGAFGERLEQLYSEVLTEHVAQRPQKRRVRVNRPHSP